MSTVLAFGETLSCPRLGTCYTCGVEAMYVAGASYPPLWSSGVSILESGEGGQWLLWFQRDGNDGFWLTIQNLLKDGFTPGCIVDQM